MKLKETWETVKHIAQYLKIVEGHMGLINRLTKAFTVKEIEESAQRIKARTGMAPLVIIDYLQVIPINMALTTFETRTPVF